MEPLELLGLAELLGLLGSVLLLPLLLVWSELRGALRCAFLVARALGSLGLSAIEPDDMVPEGLVSVLFMLPVARLLFDPLEPDIPLEPMLPLELPEPLAPAVLLEPVEPVEPLLEPEAPDEEPPGIAPDWVPPEPEVPGIPAPAASLPDGPE
jgi:hypothetical protein